MDLAKAAHEMRNMQASPAEIIAAKNAEIERLQAANRELKDERSRLLTALRDLRDGVAIAVDRALKG